MVPPAQAVFRESRELHGDLESMAEKVELLSEVLQVESMSREVCDLSRHTDELQQSIKTRLQSLQDAHKVQNMFFSFYDVFRSFITMSMFPTEFSK